MTDLIFKIAFLVFIGYAYFKVSKVYHKARTILVEIAQDINDLSHKVNEIQKKLQLPVEDRHGRIKNRINYLIKNVGFSLDDVKRMIVRENRYYKWEKSDEEFAKEAIAEMVLKKQFVRKEIECGKSAEDIYKRFEGYDGQLGLHEYAEKVARDLNSNPS